MHADVWILEEVSKLLGRTESPLFSTPKTARAVIEFILLKIVSYFIADDSKQGKLYYVWNVSASESRCKDLLKEFPSCEHLGG